MHFKLKHHFRKVFHRPKVFAPLGSQVNDSVAPCKVHSLRYGGKFTTAAATFFRYQCHHSLLVRVKVSKVTMGLLGSPHS